MPKVPNSKRNLDKAIERVAGIDNFIKIRTLVANTIVGQMLPAGVVKGGSALKLRYGNASTRFTTDLDAARREEIDSFILELTSALELGWNGFTGRVVAKRPPSPKGIPGEYIMKPYEIKLDYMGRSWLTVMLELGHDEIGDSESPDWHVSEEIVGIFIRLGLPVPQPVALMPIHHQIAQKLHALSEKNSDRAHDLIDLQLIVRNEELDYRQVKETCERLFAFRRAQLWPPVVVKGEDWDDLYAAQLEGVDVTDSVDDAIRWTNEFIKQIENL